jgi:hypothetical protein
VYALECFLDRLVHSGFAEKFVLKGGVLLAALEARRPARCRGLRLGGGRGKGTTLEGATPASFVVHREQHPRTPDLLDKLAGVRQNTDPAVTSRRTQCRGTTRGSHVDWRSEIAEPRQ